MSRIALHSNHTAAENEALMIEYSKSLTAAPEELIDYAREVVQKFNGTLVEEMTREEAINTGFLYVQGVIKNRVVENWGNWYDCWNKQYSGPDGLSAAIKDGKDPVFEFFKVTNDANHFIFGKRFNISDLVSYEELDFAKVANATEIFLPEGYELSPKNSASCTTLESIYPGFNPYEIETYEELSKVMMKKVGELLQQCYQEDSIMRGSSWPISVDSLLFLNKAARDILLPWIGTPQGQKFFLNNTYVQEYLFSSEESYRRGDSLTAENKPLCENMTFSPTPEPSSRPTVQPTSGPSSRPTELPTSGPSSRPTELPTPRPSLSPTEEPTYPPTPGPTYLPGSSSIGGGSSRDQLGEGLGAGAGALAGVGLVALVLKFLMKKFRVVAPAPNADDQGIQMGDVPDVKTSANAAFKIINVREKSSDSPVGGGRS